VVQGEWKYVEGLDERNWKSVMQKFLKPRTSPLHWDFPCSLGGSMLFNLKDDPWEQKNLKDFESERMAKLQALLRKWEEALQKFQSQAPAPQKVKLSLEKVDELQRLGYLR